MCESRRRTRAMRLMASFLLLLGIVAGLAVGAEPAAAGTHPGAQGGIYFNSGGGIRRMHPTTGLSELIVPASFSYMGYAVTQPREPAIAADGHTIVFEARFDNGAEVKPTVLFIADADKFASTVTSVGQSGGLVLGPGGLPVVNTTNLTLIPGQQPTISPDGRAVGFIRNGYVYLYQVHSTVPPFRIRQLDEGWIANDPDWSPDGRWIAFGRTRDTIIGQFEVAADVLPAIFSSIEEPRAIATSFDSFGEDMAPSWRPDSRAIAVRDNQGITVVNVDGDARKVSSYHVFGSRPADSHPVFAPSRDAGSSFDTIAVYRSSFDVTGIYVYNSDGVQGSQRGPYTGGDGLAWAGILLPVVVPPAPAPQPTTIDLGQVVRSVVTTTQSLLRSLSCGSRCSLVPR